MWHAHLVHGGLPRKDRSRSRRSMVTHIGSKALMFDMYTFFLRPRAEFGKSAAMGLGLQKHPSGLYVPHEKPVTC